MHCGRGNFWAGPPDVLITSCKLFSTQVPCCPSWEGREGDGRTVCCIKACNTLHKHTHQSVEDSAHTNTLHRPHMEVGPALALGISCIVSAEINGFRRSCHCFLPLFTQHPSLPVTLTLTPHSQIIPHAHHNTYEGAFKDGPYDAKKAQDNDVKPAAHHQHAPHQKLSPGDGPCGDKKAQDDRPTKSHAL